MEEMREIESPEQLAALHRRYTKNGELVVGSDVCFIYAYDKDGNELMLKAQAGGKVQYQEIPAKQES